MTTAAERVFDVALRHRIGLSRYSSWTVRRVLAQTNRVEKDVIARLAAAAPDSPTGARLEVLLDGIRAIQAQGWLEVTRRFEGDVASLAEAEAQFAERLTRLAASTQAAGIFSPAPSVEQVVAAVHARPFQGRFLRESLKDLEEGQARLVRETIRQGYIEGRTTSEIVRSLRGTKANQFRDGVLERNRRSIEGLVRNALTHTSSVAHEEVYRANADVIEAVEWVSTLDSRTSDICASLDGNRYPVGKGPRPPAHYGGCRSTTIPVVKPTPGVVEFKRPTYAEWLAKQTPATQDDILGRARGALFRTGGMKVESFVDLKGRRLSLAELRAKDAKAFERAGLDNPVKPPPGKPKDAVALFLADRKAQRGLLTHLMGSGAYGVDYHAQVVEAVKDRNGWKAETNDLLAIRHYTGAAYKEINKRMREYGGLLADRQFTALAARGVETLPDFVKETWRAPAQTREVGDRMWARAVVGEDYDMGNSLVSTSASRGFAVDWGAAGQLVLHVTNPRGAYVDDISLNRGEGEVLLPPGLRYRVVRKSEDDLPGQGGAPRRMRVIVLEIIDP